MMGSRDDNRRSRGRQTQHVSFPLGENKHGLPGDYQSTLADLKQRIKSERLRVALSANSALVLLYWDIGQAILDRQQRQGWGAKVIDRLSQDLHLEFPDMSGLSPRNLLFMRSFAEAYQSREIVKQLVSQIPWGHNIRILQKLKSLGERLWYVQKTMENGWSRDVLAVQLDSRLHQRQGKAANNFAFALPPQDSDMAVQIFKDPYLFDFLGTADTRKEHDVEQALIDHVQHFLLELGSGFAFVGRQILLEVGDQDFRLDLLFYHLKLRCYVVIELKAVPFDPAFTGTLNLYLSAVDDLLRHSDDKPTIGLLLCKSKNDVVVEYALDGYRRPMGVAQWETQLTQNLPEDLKGSLPSIEEIEAELSGNEVVDGGAD